MPNSSYSDNSDDYKMLTETALDYAMGVASHDWERISRAYLVPKAQMKLITGTLGAEKIYVMPIKSVWEKIWSHLPESHNHHVDILSITIFEGRIANVTMNNNNVFFDYLSLYKINGTWKIVDKLARTKDGINMPEEKLIALFGEQA